MRLTIVQFTPQFPGREENWKRIRTWAESANADVVLFPELSSCGYCYDGPEEIRGFTDPPSSIAPLEEVSRRHNRLLIGGFAEEADGQLYNSAYVVSPEGTQLYRKLHLWNKEKLIFRAGSKPLTIEFQGHRLAIEVCYDLQFPEMAAYYSREGAEALFVPMSWAEEATGPLSGLQPYNHLAIATAFSHGIFVAVANRTGIERGALFPGESSITDPYGRMQHIGPDEGILETRLDFGLLAGAKRPNERNDLDADARLGITMPSNGPGSMTPTHPTARSVG
jgi:predicted amidohydrolase